MSAEDAYVAQLIAYLSAHGQIPQLLTRIGTSVPKPNAVSSKLKSLVRRRPEFVLHDPQQSGGGGEEIILAAFNVGAGTPASNELGQYIEQMLEYLSACAGEPVLLTALGSRVRKPASFKQTIKSILESRPDLFTLEHLGGPTWSVRLSATAEPPPDPDLATQEQVAQAFYDDLMADASLRQRCQRRSDFSATYNEWKAAQLTQGRAMRTVACSRVLWVLSRDLKLIQVSSETIKFKPAGLRAKFERLREERERLEADKCGVAVRPEQALFERVVVRGATDERIVTITAARAGLQLLSFSMMRQDYFSCSFTAAGPQTLPHALVPSCPTSIRLTFRPSVEGMAGDILSLNFDLAARNGSSARFSICRFVEARCGDSDLLDDLKPSAPYSKPLRRRKPLEGEQGPKVLAPSERGGGGAGQVGRGHAPLGLHDVDERWKKQLFEDTKAAATVLEQDQQLIMNAPPAEAMRAYRRQFERLLWTEEIQLVADLSSFDLVGEKSTTLRRRGQHFELYVSGLAEKRPSVLRGDRVWVKLPNSDKRWQGRAVEINREDVLLRLHDTFTHAHIDGMRVEVRFMLGRRPLRIFYQGLQLSHLLPESILFPSSLQPELGVNVERGRLSRELRILNHKVAQNDEQTAAVRAIILGQARRFPYIVFGPPGTGKTTTIVEAVLQYVKCFPTSRVLVCAPTNTAADVVCEKLGQHGAIAGRAEMLRLMSYTRSRGEVPENVRPFTQAYDDAKRCYPPVKLEQLEKRRIVVATLSMGGSLCNLGVARGAFDLVVIDEAGQAMEPEATACLSSLLTSEGQLVLAGDAKQLGPVIHQEQAKAHGLATSFLERLMARDVYARGANGYDSRVLTKLVRNYRSHEALLELPNQLFYDGELVPCADPILRNCCLQWDELPVRGVPLLFHGIEGKDEREGNSPSWFNGDEAILILRYVESLLRMQHNRLRQEHIGVITPYNKQMQKITKLLKGQDLGGVKVGSTELFQGQERRVILISTVRSSPDFIGFDTKHNLGFLDNPKRFNVAVTRACSLLVIVGNPAVLATDPHWGELLRLCLRRGAYTGVEPPQDSGGDGGGGDGVGDDAAADGLAVRLDEIMLSANDEGEPDVSQRIQQEGVAMPDWGQD